MGNLKRLGFTCNIDCLPQPYVEASCELNFCFPESTEVSKIRDSPRRTTVGGSVCRYRDRELSEQLELHALQSGLAALDIR